MKDFQKDRIRGSLVGGAIGDALGYPVEFIDSYEEIQKEYGEQGICRFDLSQWWTTAGEGDKAAISDDTQMTLFTACGILNSRANGSSPLSGIERAYIEWYSTQMEKKSEGKNECWIMQLPALYVRRAPGNTCLTALQNLLTGKHIKNNSKGCGGIMRIAPVALYGAAQSRISSISAVDQLAAEASELPHHHPLGYIPSALIAHVIYRLVQTENPTREKGQAYVEEGLKTIQTLYAQQAAAVDYFSSLVEKAMVLAREEEEDASTIALHLGEGWVAEETAAIAIYCTLKYFDNFEKAMIAAVNHGGDSDSTGAVTGNLLGAAIGYGAIPQYYKTDLELHDVIVHVADDLYRGKQSAFE